jgi:hypothetical protein
VPFVGGSACLGTYGPVHGTCNHLNSANHRANMGRLS